MVAGNPAPGTLPGSRSGKSGEAGYAGTGVVRVEARPAPFHVVGFQRALSR